MNWRAYLIECLGAFAITFFGAYSRIQNQGDSLALALTYFMAVFALTHSFHYISGAHFNPALTISLFFTKQIQRNEAINYVAAQLTGSLVGGLMVFASLAKEASAKKAYYGYPQLYESQKFMASSLDAISVMFLILAVCSLYSNFKYRSIYAVTVAGVYLANVLAFGTISGGCINFVEVLGPSLVSLNFKYFIYYLTAHALGAAVGVTIHTNFIGYDPKENLIDDELAQEETADEKKKVD